MILTWGIILISLVAVLIGYVLIQEARAQRHWRHLVEHGDVAAIRQLLAQEMDRWRTGRVPKGVDPGLWRGVQGAEIAAAGPDYVQLQATAEGEYRFQGGQRVETLSPFDAATRLAAKLVDVVMFDVPNMRLGICRVDVYTAFVQPDGARAQQCILSITADRAAVDNLAWDQLRPREIVDRMEPVYRFDVRGNALPVDPPASFSDETPAAASETSTEEELRRNGRHRK